MYYVCCGVEYFRMNNSLQDVKTHIQDLKKKIKSLEAAVKRAEKK